jgi:hypothetical protein
MVPDDDEVSGLPVRLTCGPVYSEHGFVFLQAADENGDGYWQEVDAGVQEGPDWVRVGGGLTGVHVELDLLIRKATEADGAGPAPEAPTLRVNDYPLNIADPVSTFGLSWPVDPGTYEVRAEFVDLPSPDGVLPAQKWRIEMLCWRR